MSFCRLKRLGLWESCKYVPQMKFTTYNSNWSYNLCIYLRLCMYIYVYVYIYIHIYKCYICNMGRSDFLDMYARTRGWVRAYQANNDCPWYICYVTLPAYEKVLWQGWHFRLWHLEFKIVMMYIYAMQHNHLNCGIEFWTCDKIVKHPGIFATCHWKL